MVCNDSPCSTYHNNSKQNVETHNITMGILKRFLSVTDQQKTASRKTVQPNVS